MRCRAGSHTGEQMIYLFDELAAITEADYAAAYELLFDERKKKTARYRFKRDRILSAFAYALLLYAMKSEGCLSDAQPKFSYNRYGKPYFLSDALRNVYFNFSHCAEGIVCGISDREVGVDIEAYVQDAESIKDLVLHPNERRLVDSEKDSSALFTQLWTIKEAYTKMYGRGLAAEITELDFSDFIDCRKYGDDYLLTQQFGNYVVSAFGHHTAFSEIKHVSVYEMKNFVRIQKSFI